MENRLPLLGGEGRDVRAFSQDANWRRARLPPLSARNERGEGWGEGLPDYAHEPKVTPLPTRSSWGEGEEKCAAVDHTFLTKWEWGRGEGEGGGIKPGGASIFKW
jgi:hypothetical protein